MNLAARLRSSAPVSRVASQRRAARPHKAAVAQATNPFRSPTPPPRSRTSASAGRASCGRRRVARRLRRGDRRSRRAPRGCDRPRRRRGSCAGPAALSSRAAPRRSSWASSSRSSSASASPRASTTPRSIAFSSSRALPGHVVAREPGLRPRRSSRADCAPSSAFHLARKWRASGSDVLAALAQRRQVDRDHGEAEVEILAEAARRDLGAQVAIGRGDDAHVHLARRVAADAPHACAPAARAAACAWNSRSTSPISSRKSVPPWACSKRPARARSAPVKAPRSWPKSSDSSTPAGERLAVHRDEGPADAIAVVVHGARDELLAGAALAGDEHRRGALRGAPRAVERVAHGARSRRRSGRPSSGCAARRAGSGSRARAASSSSARCTSALSSSLSKGFST